MASVTFKRLPDQSNGRKRYAPVFDRLGRNLGRKKPMTGEQMMAPTYIIGPTYMPGGSDQRAPRLPGDRL